MMRSAWDSPVIGLRVILDAMPLIGSFVTNICTRSRIRIIERSDSESGLAREVRKRQWVWKHRLDAPSVWKRIRRQAQVNVLFGVGLFAVPTCIGLWFWDLIAIAILYVAVRQTLWLLGALMAAMLLIGFVLMRRAERRRLLQSIVNARCSACGYAGCGYPINSTASQIAGSVETCSECGAAWPLLPSPVRSCVPF